MNHRSLELLRPFTFMLLLTTTGCMTDGADQYFACQQSFAPIDANDASLGFSANEVLVLLQQGPPEHIKWDEITLTEGQDNLTIEVLGIADQAQLATPNGDDEACPAGGESLLIPLQIRLSIANGEAESTGVLPVYAAALNTSQIYMETGWELPVELTGDYDLAFQAFFESDYASQGFSLDGLYFSATSEWSGGALDISFKASGANSSLVGTAWRGHWGE